MQFKWIDFPEASGFTDPPLSYSAGGHAQKSAYDESRMVLFREGGVTEFEFIVFTIDRNACTQQVKKVPAADYVNMNSTPDTTGSFKDINGPFLLYREVGVGHYLMKLSLDGDNNVSLEPPIGERASWKLDETTDTNGRAKLAYIKGRDQVVTMSLVQAQDGSLNPLIISNLFSSDGTRLHTSPTLNLVEFGLNGLMGYDGPPDMCVCGDSLVTAIYCGAASWTPVLVVATTNGSSVSQSVFPFDPVYASANPLYFHAVSDSEFIMIHVEDDFDSTEALIYRGTPSSGVGAPQVMTYPTGYNQNYVSGFFTEPDTGKTWIITSHENTTTGEVIVNLWPLNGTSVGTPITTTKPESYPESPSTSTDLLDPGGVAWQVGSHAIFHRVISTGVWWHGLLGEPKLWNPRSISARLGTPSVSFE